MKKLLFIFLFALLWMNAHSQTKQIADLQQQQQILQEEIKSTNKLFLDVKKQATTLLQRIGLINKQIASRKEMIILQNQEIAELEREQERLQTEIARLDQELVQKKKGYAKAIKRMQMNRMGDNKLFFLLSGKNFGELVRRMQYLRTYSKWEREQADKIKHQNIELNLKRKALKEAQDSKQKTLAALQTEQQSLVREENTRRAEMQEARGKQKELQQELNNKQQQARKLDAQIESLIAEEVARQERAEEARRLAAQAKAEKKRKAEALAKKKKEKTATPKQQTEAEKDSEAQPERESVTNRQPKPHVEEATEVDETFHLSSNFAANKGKLPMPVTGTASIVGRFGQRRHSEWNVTTNSNGIDIQAQKGASVRSVFKGEVSKIFSVPGYNTCVIVRHGNYYTFYGNIYDLFVKAGDTVKAGQALGRIYTDPDTGISTMHFQLWQKTSKLNPSPWLKK